MFDKIFDTIEQNSKIVVSFIQPEPVRKMVNDIVVANFALAREVIPATKKFTETLTNLAVKSTQ
jgi:hypothetical protein